MTEAAPYNKSTLEAMMTAHSIKPFGQYERMVLPEDKTDSILADVYDGNKDAMKRANVRAYAYHLKRKADDILLQLNTKYEADSKNVFLSTEGRFSEIKL